MATPKVPMVMQRYSKTVFSQTSILIFFVIGPAFCFYPCSQFFNHPTDSGKCGGSGKWVCPISKNSASLKAQCQCLQKKIAHGNFQGCSPVECSGSFTMVIGNKSTCQLSFQSISSFSNWESNSICESNSNTS